MLRKKKKQKETKMKKLIVAVAAAVIGVAVQAATVNWSVNAIQSSPDTAIGAGWIVQVCV